MNAKILLRISAVLIMVHVIGHVVGHITWDTPHDPRMEDVVAAMKSNKADFMGATKSMADYYNGFSLMIFGLFALSILLLWFVSGFVHNQRHIAKGLLYPMGVLYISFGFIEYIYFFPFAASISFIAGMLIILAVKVANKSNRP